MNGFLNLLKPPGMSSGAVVAAVKRLTGEKVGHAGTLDPQAAGVLPMMIGRATRLLNYFTDHSKTYVAEIAFTGATDTQDAQGVLITPGRGAPERERIEAILPRFTGAILQRPPAYSAIKQGGTPLYALARKGNLVETQAREIVINALTLGEKTREGGYMLTVDCGGGTYIRTLCHDLGQALDCPAHMRFLLRTRAGAFSIDRALTLEEITAAADEKRLDALLLPLDYPLGGLPTLDVPRALEKPARNGAKLPAALIPELGESARCLIRLSGALLGVGRRVGDVIRFEVGLTGGDA